MYNLNSVFKKIELISVFYLQMIKIDLTYLETVGAGDTDFIKQMLEMFQKSTLPEIDNLEQFYETKDWAMFTSTAHKIKAPMQMLGQESMREQLIQLEMAGKGLGNRDTISETLTSLKGQIAELNTEIDKMIKSL